MSVKTELNARERFDEGDLLRCNRCSIRCEPDKCIRLGKIIKI